MIKNTEDRIKFYKDLLQEIHKNPALYPQWFKEDIRDSKNREDRWLKELIAERTGETRNLEWFRERRKITPEKIMDKYLSESPEQDYTEWLENRIIKYNAL